MLLVILLRLRVNGLMVRLVEDDLTMEREAYRHSAFALMQLLHGCCFSRSHLTYDLRRCMTYSGLLRTFLLWQIMHARMTAGMVHIQSDLLPFVSIIVDIRWKHRRK